MAKETFQLDDFKTKRLVGTGTGVQLFFQAEKENTFI